MKIPLRRIFHVVAGITGIVIGVTIFIAINYPHRESWLFWAAKNDHPRVAHLVLSTGIPADIEDEDHRTPLYWAVFNGHENMVHLLLAHGASLWLRGPKDYTYYNIAKERGHLELALKVYDLSSDLDNHQYTRLHWAVETENPALVQKALQLGDDPNGNHGDPLITAVIVGNLPIVKLLMSAGADCHVKSWQQECVTADFQYPRPKGAACVPTKNQGISLLHLAADRGHVEVAEFLIAQGLDPNAEDDFGRTPLWYTIGPGRLEVMKLLIAHGADVKHTTPDGANLLHLAAGENSDPSKTVDYLLSLGVDPNLVDHHGHTPLGNSLCTYYKSIKVLQLLLAHGAEFAVQPDDADCIYQFGADGIVLLLDHGLNLEIRDSQGRSLLHHASLIGNRDLAESLLGRGADINARDRHGATPIFEAVCDEVMMDYLLSHGAKIHDYDAEGNGLLHAAAERACLTTDRDFRAKGGGQGKKNSEIVEYHQARIEYFLGKGLKVTEKNHHGQHPLHLAVSAEMDRTNDIFGSMAALLEAGAPVNARDNLGQTPLHRAAVRLPADEQVAELLLKAGAEVNALDREGLTALHFAAAVGAEKTVITIIAGGADVNARSEEGWTPLMIAADASSEGIVKSLLASGATTGGTSGNGTSLLHCAAAGRISSLVQQLLRQGANVNSANREGVTSLHLAASGRSCKPFSSPPETRGDPGLWCGQNSGKEGGFIANCRTDSQERLSEINLLLQAGALVTVKDLRGETPLDGARKRLAELEATQDKYSRYEAAGNQRKIIKQLEDAAAAQSSRAQ